MGVVKAKALGNKYPQLSEWQRKSDTNTQEDAAKAKYIHSGIYDKVPHKTYSAHGDETTSSEHSKIFTADDGRLNERECTYAL